MTPEQALETLREVGKWVVSPSIHRRKYDDAVSVLARLVALLETHEQERADWAIKDRAMTDYFVDASQRAEDALADARQLREALELAVQSIEDAYGGYAFVPENTLEHDAVVQGHAALRGHDPALTAGAIGGNERVIARQESEGAGQVEQLGEPSQPLSVAAAPAASVERGQRQPEEPT